MYILVRKLNICFSHIHDLVNKYSSTSSISLTQVSARQALFSYWFYENAVVYFCIVYCDTAAESIHKETDSVEWTEASSSNGVCLHLKGPPPFCGFKYIFVIERAFSCDVEKEHIMRVRFKENMRKCTGYVHVKLWTTYFRKSIIWHDIEATYTYIFT